MRARSWAGSDVPSWGTARPAAPATSAASSANRFMAQNIHASALMAGRRRLITFPRVSEFVFGTHNAAFVRSEEHTSELQSLAYLVCRLLLEKKNRYLLKGQRPSTHPACARRETSQKTAYHLPHHRSRSNACELRQAIPSLTHRAPLRPSAWS